MSQEEEIELKSVAVHSSENGQNGDIHITCETATSCCEDKHHRKLAISSIICGISCIGICALIHSVKAHEHAVAQNKKKEEKYSRKAKKYGILSICLWLSLLVLVPALMALISYLLTLID